MEIPKTMKIGGHTYKIIFPYIFKERFDRAADCDPDTCEIRITEKSVDIPRSESNIAVSLIHEILHAIDFTTGHKMFDGQEGEKKIEGLSEGIYQVLVDNGYLDVDKKKIDSGAQTYNHRVGDIVSIDNFKDNFIIDFDKYGNITLFEYNKWIKKNQ